MPSYPSPYWDDENAAAEHLLELGFTITCGVIRPPSIGYPFYQNDTRTAEAVNYLCGEWDYAFEGNSKCHSASQSI